MSITCLCKAHVKVVHWFLKTNFKFYPASIKKTAGIVFNSPFYTVKPRHFSSANVAKSKTRKLLPFEADINVTNDVMLFKNERSTFYRLVSAFGLAQLIFWLYLAKFAHGNLQDASPEVEKNQIEAHKDTHPKTVLFLQWMNFSENKYRIGITVSFATVGYLVAMGAFLFTLRSVRYLVLLKGGQFVRVITYAPVGARRITIPLSYISGQQALSKDKPYYPFKIKGYWFNFLADMNGELLEQKIFQNTIAISRNLKNR